MRVIAAVAAITSCWRGHFVGRGRGVTRLALCCAMSTRERILGIFVVIESPKFPTIGVVTMLTCRPELALVLSILVAGRADPQRIAVSLRAVAGFARHRCMQANQWKARDVVIEHDFLPPVRFGVARFAACAELAFMRVVAFMTSDAGCRELVAIEIALVAGIALDLFVCAPQRKFRRFVVIEFNGFPFFRAVTGLAFRAIAALVNILDFVAIGTGVRQVFVALANMTNRAWHLGVCAVERELGFAMVKGLWFSPSVFGVA